MYDEEIKALVAEILKETQGKGITNKSLAEKIGIAPTRFSTLVNQGDMKLSSFLRILEVAGFSLEVKPCINGETIKFLTKNPCLECSYKHLAESMTDIFNVRMDPETNKVIVEK